MKKLIVDYRISKKEENSLLKLGYDLLACPSSNKLYYAICGHPDIQIHIIDEKNIIVHKDMPPKFIENLKKLNINVIVSASSLSNKYPQDIVLNAVNFSKYFIHYLNYTDKNLLSEIKMLNKKLINTKQGYTKCSTAIVSDNAIITSDKNIAKSLQNENIDILLLSPGDILLPGLNYGFIGGTCGLIEKDILAFYGSLECYAYGKEVLNFLKKHKVEPIFLSKGKLIDRGSILKL
ncbi:hypothetical protein IRP63_08590 [Clostridium botulinum]|uniref:DUF6873 domain-containing protein n=3 Tax=Clostridium botulinum TaxID=1491 RepID=A0A0A0IH78_CLOBO|nr:hypothetical protein [Clostridium botulinum]KGM99606.1 hypothetical protein Z955_07250 [Clostridium botulinum C/D str. DC5]KOC50305.1 hypothetical protein ADU89_14650 [Clostridium botulinum]KOC51995.1 hypothetical protein ADU90_14910 [Clostridium botulinum]MCD3234940.1 hypothetical protein [Clostridium botulinum D/C]MCD3240802.1 hypothetical protein [Clostridium botulinum D/C]